MRLWRVRSTCRLPVAPDSCAINSQLCSPTQIKSPIHKHRKEEREREILSLCSNHVTWRNKITISVLSPSVRCVLSLQRSSLGVLLLIQSSKMKSIVSIESQELTRLFFLLPIYLDACSPSLSIGLAFEQLCHLS